MKGGAENVTFRDKGGFNTKWMSPPNFEAPFPSRLFTCMKSCSGAPK